MPQVGLSRAINAAPRAFAVAPHNSTRAPRFKDEEEAVQIANDIAYGLGAGVSTQSLKRAHIMAARIKAGTVWVDTYRAVSFMMPFGPDRGARQR
jgi:Aldehyde dehydrogenase family